MDPRVVDLPSLEMVSPFKAIILPMRSKTHCSKLSSYLTEQGSPCLPLQSNNKPVYKLYLTEQGINAQVEIAMTYGNPSMQSAVKIYFKMM